MYQDFHPVYCDYIAQVVQKAINKDSAQIGSLVCGAGKVRFDIGPGGFVASTKKAISVADINGRLYEITVQEIKNESNKR